MEQEYECHYNAEYKRKYYYDPIKKESLWEVPKNAKVIDKRTEEEKKLENPLKIQAEIILPGQPEYEKLLKIYPGLAKKKDESESESDEEKPKEMAGKRKEPEKTEIEENKENEVEKKEEITKEQKEEEKKKITAYRNFAHKHVQELMKRPARRQIKDMKKDTAYQEGNYDYNMWYDKYLTDRRNEQEKAPSLYKCDPELDTGYTRGDLMEKSTSYCCVYFARGACSEGSKCRYYHRVPQPEDLLNEENAKDVFGRTRHATLKEDLSGIGSFNRNCRAISVCDMKVPDTAAGSIRDTVKMLYDEFSKWGEIEDIKFIPHKAMANIRYTHRFYAEFAKEAMQDQSLGGNDVITIKWCLYEDPQTAKTKEEEQKEIFLNAVRKKQKLEEQRQIAKIEAEKIEQKRIEELKEIQRKHFEQNIESTNLYNPVFYKDFKPADKISKSASKVLQQEQSKITENCSKMNEILQRISHNYSDNQ